MKRTFLIVRLTLIISLLHLAALSLTQNYPKITASRSTEGPNAEAFVIVIIRWDAGYPPPPVVGGYEVSVPTDGWSIYGGAPLTLGPNSYVVLMKPKHLFPSGEVILPNFTILPREGNPPLCEGGSSIEVPAIIDTRSPSDKVDSDYLSDRSRIQVSIDSSGKEVWTLHVTGEVIPKVLNADRRIEVVYTDMNGYRVVQQIPFTAAGLNYDTYVPLRGNIDPSNFSFFIQAISSQSSIESYVNLFRGEVKVKNSPEGPAKFIIRSPSATMGGVRG